jgi:hypothetical protein
VGEVRCGAKGTALARFVHRSQPVGGTFGGEPAHEGGLTMGRRILGHMRSHVIAYVALFFALTGTAIALPNHNTVFSDDIVNGEVKTLDIKDGAVKTEDVRDDTQPGGGLGAADLKPDAVGSSEIADNAVGSSEIQAGAVRGSELLSYHVHTGTGVNVNDGTALDGDFQQVTATAQCTAGEQLVGAYAEWTSGGDENATQEIIPDFGANSVTARGITDNGTTETFRAAAVCVFD